MPTIGVRPGVALRMPEPCGECAGCRLGAEVAKMLEFVDRRMLGPARDAAQAVADARWRGAGEDAMRQLGRAFDRAKAQWMEARARVLTAETISAATCLKTFACYLLKQPRVEPPTVDAVPASVRDEALRELAASTASWRGDRCYRCGAGLDHEPLLPLSVCGACFGRDL